ncbi:hypothetical protein BDV59DRAFT_5762 [Aspergillus ambiguus]|uniref:uncharacterized protein n=1 Tax=Aspergillus ambiguus TaxID=176160 RepID=UPI003CCD9E7A
MNVWSGAITLHGEPRLQGIQLIDRSSTWQSDILKGATLNLCGFVNPALLPLYARIGPNLELHANDSATQQWLKTKLLGALWLEEEDLDRFHTIQCPVGFIVNVSSATLQTRPSSAPTTDLLIYGILSTGTSIERPPTPPVSSSPCSDYPLPHGSNQELRIYAAPLSSPLVTKATALPPPETAEFGDDDSRHAQFLPDLRSPSPKRKRVATLFESVAQHHKRVRQKGGEAVSQLMAHSASQPSQPSQQIQSQRATREPDESGLGFGRMAASHRARSLSLGTSLHAGKPLEPRVEAPRPGSNRSHTREFASRWNTAGAFIETTSSRKEKKETEFSPALLSSEGKVDRASATSPKDAESIMLENKNTIARTILTCMRLYGFNRQSTRSGSSSKNHIDHEAVSTNADDRMATDAGPLGGGASTDEDEFKSMYHATYRASTFALRKYLKESTADGGPKSPPPLLEKGKAMAYIDEFLRLFCEET